MNEYLDKTYWIAIAHMPKWHIERTNRLIIQVVHENKMSWADFFDLDKKGWRELFDFNDKELADLEYAKNDMPRLAFIAEQLHGEVVDAKTINSKDLFETVSKNEVNEQLTSYEDGKRNIEKDIIELLNKGTYSSKEILLALKLDWDSRKLTSFLKKNPNIKAVAGKPAKFTRNDVI